jgi:hypothetical protein
LLARDRSGGHFSKARSGAPPVKKPASSKETKIIQSRLATVDVPKNVPEYFFPSRYFYIAHMFLKVCLLERLDLT